jgi:hypothetical protein
MVSLSFESVSKAELRLRAQAMMHEAHGILDVLGDEREALASLQAAIDRLSGATEEGSLGRD